MLQSKEIYTTSKLNPYILHNLSSATYLLMLGIAWKSHVDYGTTFISLAP